MPKPLPLSIRLWFAIDALLALLPPVHWAASGSDPVLGAPRIIFYLFATSLFISTSVVAAYFHDAPRDRGPRA